MEKKPNEEFIVTKHYYTFVCCFACNGSGVTRRTFRKTTYIEDCLACNGEGRTRFTRSEQYPLELALKELKENQSTKILNYGKEN